MQQDAGDLLPVLGCDPNPSTVQQTNSQGRNYHWSKPWDILIRLTLYTVYLLFTAILSCAPYYYYFTLLLLLLFFGKILLIL